MVSAIISFFIMTPIYESSTQILVNQKQEGTAIQFNEVQTNIQLTNTYKVIIKSPVILEQVKEKLHLEETVQKLNKKLK